MKKLLFILIIIFGIFSCEKNEDNPTVTKINYVGFESGFIIGVDPVGITSQEVVIASSNTDNNPRTYNLNINTDLTTADPNSYNIPTMVTIPANSNIGMFIMDVNGKYVNPIGDDIVSISFSTNDDTLFISNPISLNLKQVCSNPELILDITFDNWPEEIYWVIIDSNNDTIFESATPPGFGAYENLTGGISRTFCLTPGNYTFQIYDQFNDGAGPFSLTFDNNLIFSSNGSYGGFTQTTFSIN